MILVISYLENLESKFRLLRRSLHVENPPYFTEILGTLRLLIGFHGADLWSGKTDWCGG
jgi:hypothetical protein